MYIKTTTNKAGQKYYHLVESYWKDGKSCQRTLLSLGRAQEDKLEELTKAISKHKEIYTALELAKQIDVKDTYILGPLLILERLFEMTGINEVLKTISHKHLKLDIDLRQIVFTMIAVRFMKPCSKLKLYEYWQDKLCPLMVSKKIELHQLYRALDVLQFHKEEIEKGLYYHGKDLLNLVVDVVLYDLTTLRFESTREDLGELRKFGYSKERRSDCTQVVLGLLVTPEGIPIGFEVYPGNTFEGQTVESIVEKMREKFCVRRFIFVADRGLFSKKNLEVLRQKDKRGQDREEFIVGMKLGILKKRHEEFYDRSRYQEIDKDGDILIYETEHEGDRCIITWSKERAKRDKKVREDILQKIGEKLTKKKITAKTFVSNKNYHRYVKGLENGGGFELNKTAIEEEEKKDGYFGVITNVRDISAQQIISEYKRLWMIEDAFGEIKGTLKTRPVFHWKDERIVGHLMMCFLAYLCESHLTKSLRDKKIFLTSKAIETQSIEPRPLSVVEGMQALMEVRAIPVELRDHTVWVRTDITGNAAKMFSAIGLKPPAKRLEIHHLK